MLCHACVAKDDGAADGRCRGTAICSPPFPGMHTEEPARLLSQQGGRRVRWWGMARCIGNAACMRACMHACGWQEGRRVPAAGAEGQPAVVHACHFTPIHRAAARRRPRRGIVTTVSGSLPEQQFQQCSFSLSNTHGGAAHSTIPPIHAWRGVPESLNPHGTACCVWGCCSRAALIRPMRAGSVIVQWGSAAAEWRRGEGPWRGAHSSSQTNMTGTR